MGSKHRGKPRTERENNALVVTKSPSSVSHSTQQNCHGAVCYKKLHFSAIISHCLKLELLLSSTAVGKCKNIFFMEPIYIFNNSPK